jgi:hypothetical protein
MVICPWWICVTPAQAWVAYNDMLRQTGDSTAPNVSGWTLHNVDRDRFTGRLVDFETGSEKGLPIVTFTMGGAGLSVSGGGAGGNPDVGTDAYEVFHGIVDFGPDIVYYGDPGWWVEIEFTELDPRNTYVFVGTAIRSNQYPNRISLFTILDAVDFVNNSSPGVVTQEGPVTELLAGDNRSTGYVVRWDDIVPSARGTFKIRAEATVDSDGGRAYPLGGFMLAETGGTGNRPPEVDAGDYDAMIWPMRTVQLHPIVHDDDPCDLGLLAYQWTQIRGPEQILFDPAADIPDPVAIFPGPGEYELRVQVWDELLQEADGSVIISIAEPLWGDFDDDRRVNGKDLEVFAAQWLDPPGGALDLDIDSGVNFSDFAMMATNWRRGEGKTLVINELMARNDLTLADAQGDYDDWIELYNAGEEALDAGGLYLTDDLSEPRKWRFPTDDPSATTVPAGGTLLVWADNDLADEGLHAGFELDVLGDDIALFDTDGTTRLDHIHFDRQTPDVSFGREPDAAVHWVTLAPSPGTSNNGSFLAVVADTTFSHDRGFYVEPFEVTIRSATEDAVIHYTLDGSTPTPSRGLVYSGPIGIGATTTLRALAFKAGWRATNVDTQTYIFLDDVILQGTDPSTGSARTPAGYPDSWGSVAGDYQMDPDVVGQMGRDIFGGLYAESIHDDMKAVPTLSLVMDREDWFGSRGIYINKSQDGTERVTSLEYIDPNTGKDFQVNCAMAMQGGVSGGGTSLNRWKSFKLSMRPRFKTRIDDGTPTGGPSKLAESPFIDSPVERHNSLVLDAVLNHSWLHPDSGQRNTALYVQDQYVADLHNAMGGQSPHGAYAHVYLNGLYWGMYYIHERPDHTWAAQIFGGDEDSYDAIKHQSGSVINNGLGGSATANFNAMLSAVNAVSSNPDSLPRYEALCQLLDVDNLITYLLANWYTGNHDWPHKNWYATHRNSPEGRWRFHSWDAEHSLEGSNSIGRCPLDIHAKLSRSAEYRLRFADHIQRHCFHDGALTYPATAVRYEARMRQIERAIVGESARWGDNRQPRPYTRQDWWNTQAGKLSGFFPNRSQSLLSGLRNADLYPDVAAPVFHVNGVLQHGGRMAAGDDLSMGNGPGTTYTTRDGTDPRLPGGAVNTASASVVTSTIRLNASAHLRARTLNGGVWSALSEAVFAVGPVAESLRITEIMYHPADTGRPDDPDAEYIELTNAGTAAIGLHLVSFADGIDFTFPDISLAPGAYCVVVRDPQAFAARYGSEGHVVGPYTGSLSNAGERIVLLDAGGDIIHDFRYEDNWFDETDGKGFSLTVKDPTQADLTIPQAWRPSAQVGGSPGFDDAGDAP